MWWNKKKNEPPELHVYFVPASQAETHPLTRDLFNKQAKIVTAAAAASILIPLAAHAAVGVVSHVSSKSQNAHVLDLQQEILLEGCYDQDGTFLLEGGFLCFCVGGTIDNNDATDIPKDPLAMGIWKICTSQDGTAIRLIREKWMWEAFLQPPERSRWTCQSLKFRDLAITIEIDVVGGEKASWEFVFSSVSEEELSSLMELSTEWRPAPSKPTTMEEQGKDVRSASSTPAMPMLAKASGEGPSSDAIETTYQEPTPPSAITKPDNDEPPSSEGEACRYYVPANVRMDVIETTRPHVLAPLLQESAKAGSTIATPLSKLVQSQIVKR